MSQQLADEVGSNPSDNEKYFTAVVNDKLRVKGAS